MKPVYLVGFMGCGKTTIGKQLSKRINCSFFDLDKLIEHESGQTIESIFSSAGENAFRELEHNCLDRTLSFTNSIIAVGGGTPCFYDNMNNMLENGTVIYLQTPTATLFKRILSSPKKRPLFKNDHLEFEKLFNAREPFYLKAHHIINCTNKKNESISNEIILRLTT